MAFASQPEFVQKITSALGLERVRSLTIHLDVNSIPTVDVEFLPDRDQMDGVADAIGSKSFHLLEVKDSPHD